MHECLLNGLKQEHDDHETTTVYCIQWFYWIDKEDKIQNKQNDFACLFAIIFLNVFSKFSYFCKCHICYILCILGERDAETREAA